MAEDKTTDDDESWDLDKLVAEVIKAYQTAVPGEEEDAVKCAIVRSGWIQDPSHA